ncbi:MAG: hypothetical protein ACOY3X_09455 [Pseudomonadota bacterium]
MKTLQTLSLATLLAASVGAQAAGFSYDYLEGGFGELDEADAIYLGGAKSLGKEFGLTGALGLIDFDGGDGTVLRGGGLFHTPIQKDLDFVGTLELVFSDFEVDLPGGSVSDDDLGFAAGAGVRYSVQDNFQLEGKLVLVEVDPFDDGLGISLNARYYMNRQLSAAVGVADDADYDGLYVNLRYDLK